MKAFKRFSQNTAGRDYVVGDIHGCFSRLQTAMDEIKFDPTKDRLFSVGDLIDRGPECEDVLSWLARPWFHPVRGNHDDYVCRFTTCDTVNWMRNGGAWFQGLPWAMKQELNIQFKELPFAIEVETARGRVGILHADCPAADWNSLESLLELRGVQNVAMWSRSRIGGHSGSGKVRNIDVVIVGHTPVDDVTLVDNVLHIDTAGWKARGHFTVMDLAEAIAITETLA